MAEDRERTFSTASDDATMFATKLPSEMLMRLRIEAMRRNVPIYKVVYELLDRGLPRDFRLNGVKFEARR